MARSRHRGGNEGGAESGFVRSDDSGHAPHGGHAAGNRSFWSGNVLPRATDAHAKVNAIPSFRHPNDKKQRDFSPCLAIQHRRRRTRPIRETTRSTGLCVKESSGHVRKISHIRRVSPAVALLQAAVLAAWPDVCGETERNFSSRRATGGHPAAERDDRPVASSRRAHEDVRPLLDQGRYFRGASKSVGPRRGRVPAIGCRGRHCIHRPLIAAVRADRLWWPARREQSAGRDGS